MTRKVTLMIVALMLPLLASAQKQFTLEDLNFGGTNYRNMIPQHRTIAWWGDTPVRLSADTVWTVNPKTGAEKLLFTRAALPTDGNLSVLSWAEFPYAGKPIVKLIDGNYLVLIDFKARKTLFKMKNDAAVSEWHPVSRNLAYIEDDNLWVARAEVNMAPPSSVTTPAQRQEFDDHMRVQRLTTDGSRDIVYGQAVHRNEFGIEGGLFWNPQGTRLAFYRMDQSMVADYPLVNVPELDDTTRVEATPAPEKYPMAGRTSHLVTVGVYDFATDHTVYLDAGDPTDRYFTNIAWSPDGNTIYMQELNRDQNDCRLVSYDAVTGQRLKELYRETHPKYVEPQHPIVFLPWDATKFLMYSERDGYNHLYLFDVQGNMLKQVTSGNWVVMDLLGFDSKAHTAIIASNEANPIGRNLYSVNIDTGKRTRIDEGGRGWHDGSLNTSGTMLVDVYQEPDVPRNIAFADTRTGKTTRYFTAPDPWQGYTVPTYECGTLTAADGTTPLYYRMVKPADFDPAKKYPTVVYVYGGPHAHNVDAGWHYRSRSWETYMAQRGYILFILDNRGSENRGRDFEQATFRQLGQVEMADQMQGVKYLQSLPYVDTTRLGVHGWSFGGFMTISLMTNYPDVFKVGVAGGPVIDWKWYEVMYGERYMDTPQTNPEGYELTSLIPKAKDLKGRLQIIIGLNDPTVVPQHAYSFLKACIAAGTQPDFYVYPGQGHNMRGHQSVHLHERITRYFDDYLK